MESLSDSAEMTNFFTTLFQKKLTKPSVWVLVLVIGLFRLADTSSLVALPQISRDFGVSANVAQLSVTVYLSAICFMLIFWGPLIDRFGRRPCFLTAGYIFLIGTLLCLFSWTYESFFLGRFLQGIGSSNGSVLVQTMIRDVYHKDERGKAYSTLGMFIPLAPALGPLLGGVIDEFFHWRAIFFVTILLNGGFIGYYFLRVRETQNKNSPKADIKATMLVRLLAKDHVFLGCALLMGTVFAASAVNSAEGSFLFIGLFGLTPGQYGVTAGLIAFSFGLGGFVSKQLLKAHYTPDKVISLGVKALFSLGCFYVILAGVRLTAPGLDLFGFLMNVFLICSMTLSAGMIGPNTFIKVSDLHPKSAGTVSAVFTFIYFMYGNLFSAVMSAAHSGTQYALPMVLFFIAFLSTLIYFFLVRGKKEG